MESYRETFARMVGIIDRQAEILDIALEDLHSLADECGVTKEEFEALGWQLLRNTLEP